MNNQLVRVLNEDLQMVDKAERKERFKVLLCITKMGV
jgi:hypothetical protein